jgi:uncharacterized protein YkwD
MPFPRIGWKTTRARRRPRLVRFMIAALTILGTALIGIAPAATASPAHKHHRRHHRARSASACAGANASVRTAPASVLRTAVVCLINQDRAQHHLPPLQASPDLNRSAQGWTNVMVSSDQFTHGANFAARISAAGYVWRSAGENIATGYSTPNAVVRAWMASTGHCQNILNPTYRNIGTGVSVRPVKGWATGQGTWTQDFALGMNESAPSGNTAPMDGCPY